MLYGHITCFSAFCLPQDIVRFFRVLSNFYGFSFGIPKKVDIQLSNKGMLGCQFAFSAALDGKLKKVC